MYQELIFGPEVKRIGYMVELRLGENPSRYFVLTAKDARRLGSKLIEVVEEIEAERKSDMTCLT